MYVTIWNDIFQLNYHLQTTVLVNPTSPLDLKTDTSYTTLLALRLISSEEAYKFAFELQKIHARQYLSLSEQLNKSHSSNKINTFLACIFLLLH